MMESEFLSPFLHPLQFLSPRGKSWCEVLVQPSREMEDAFHGLPIPRVGKLWLPDQTWPASHFVIKFYWNIATLIHLCGYFCATMSELQQKPHLPHNE